MTVGRNIKLILAIDVGDGAEGTSRHVDGGSHERLALGIGDRSHHMSELLIVSGSIGWRMLLRRRSAGHGDEPIVQGVGERFSFQDTGDSLEGRQPMETGGDGVAFDVLDNKKNLRSALALNLSQSLGKAHSFHACRYFDGSITLC